MVEFHQNISLFNTQPNRPRASPASFKHVGQTPYSRGFKFGEKGPVKILVHFCLQVRVGRVSSKFYVFSTHNLISLGPHLQVSSMLGRPLTQGASNLGKRGRSKFWSIFAYRWNFIKILSLFNTQPNRPRASPAGFKHVGQTPYSRGFKFGERGRSKVWSILPTGARWLNFIKILSLFNTQPNRPRASPASFKHVGQAPYSRGFKFGEKGPIKILVHFCLQVRGG